MLRRERLSELRVLHKESADALTFDNVTDRIGAVTRRDHHYNDVK